MEHSEILYQIVNNAAEKRGKEWWIEPTESWGDITQDEAKDKALGIVGGSEIGAVQGIVKTLGLDEEVVTKLVGPKDEEGKFNKNGEIYTASSISPEIAGKIQEAMNDGDKNKSVLDILSTIHDTWVRNNPDNFLATKNGKPRDKEYQFVPLELLSWKEVESDLVFLQPILEASGIEIDEETLQQEFEVRQTDFITKNELYSPKQIEYFLSWGEKRYPALDGLETKNGGKITELLKDEQIRGKVAQQICEQLQIKSKEELLNKIAESKNPLFNREYHVKSDRTFTQVNVDELMSAREYYQRQIKNHAYYEKDAPQGEENNYTVTETGRTIEPKEVTPKEIATGSIKKGITSKLVDGAKSLFLGRDEKSTGKDEAENDGRDEM